MMGRRGIKAFGLGLVAILALAGVMASGALGANLNLGDEFYEGEAGFFLIGGAETPKGLTKETISGKLVGERIVLIPNKSVEIGCSSGEITEGFFANEYEDYIAGTMKKGGYGSATVLLKGCKVNELNSKGELTGKEVTVCTKELNKESSPPGEHHITLKGTTFLKKHEGKTYLLAEPYISSKLTAEEAKVLTLAFSIVKFGGLCSLPETVELTGSLVVASPPTDAVNPKQSSNTFSEAGKIEQALFGAKLKFGTSEAFIKGEAETGLTGVNAGKAWGAM